MQPPYGGPSQGPYNPYQQHQQPYNPQLAKLESDTTTWLIVAAAGWFVGMMWICGPLAWYHGNQIIQGYQALGMQPTSNATTLRIVGMITTILSIVVIVCVCAIVIFIGGFAMLA